ncbi:hypothetical protein M8J76_011554 [Diaphorina citri]|nr:hypothetical protein M8J76_011554 [Diaphorina citri]
MAQKMSKLLISLSLLRIVLPLCLTACICLRHNALTGLYLVLLLYLPVVPAPEPRSMKGKYLVLFVLCLAGVLRPSIPGAVYFVTFLACATWWATYRDLGRGFAYLCRILLLPVTIHLVCLYVYQMQWTQTLIPPRGWVARYYGLTPLVETNCDDPRLIHISDVEWPSFAEPLILIFLYYVLWFESGSLLNLVAWSIMYHSWLGFILLLWSSLLWMMPNQRQSMLRSSPVLVFYAEFLLVAQYLYGMDLEDSELPYIDGSDQIGFNKVSQYAFKPLIIKNSTPGPNKTYNSAEWLGFYKVSDSNTLAHLLRGYIEDPQAPLAHDSSASICSELTQQGFHTPLEEEAPLTPRPNSYLQPPTPTSAIMTVSLEGYLEPHRMSFSSPPNSEAIGVARPRSFHEASFHEPTSFHEDSSYPVFSPPPYGAIVNHRRTSSLGVPWTPYVPRKSISNSSHHTSIRSGDYYMFDDMDDEELDLIMEKTSEDTSPDEDLDKDQTISRNKKGFGVGVRTGASMIWQPLPFSSVSQPAIR